MFNKNYRLIFFVGLVLLSLSISVHSEVTPSPIVLVYLTSPDKNETSALSGECSGDTSSYKIECKFTQVRFRLALKPDELEEKIEQMKKQLREDSKGLEKFVSGFCKNINKNKSEIKEKIKENDKLNVADTEQVQQIMSICDKPTYEKVEKFMIRMLKNETKTCEVSADADEKTTVFEKIQPNKWISNQGPGGLCKEVLLIELEHEPNQPYLWTFKQTRTHIRDDNELCKGFEVGKTLVYDWHERTMPAQCEFIKFGF